MKNMIIRGGGVVSGMIVSEIIAQSLSKFIPLNIANKDDIIQTVIGAGSIGIGMTKGDGLVGEVLTFFGLGAVISAMLGFLKLKIPYLAQAGEEFEEVFVDEDGQEIAFAGEDVAMAGEDVAMAGEEIYYDTETGELVAMAGYDEEPQVVEMIPLDEDNVEDGMWVPQRF